MQKNIAPCVCVRVSVHWSLENARSCPSSDTLGAGVFEWVLVTHWARAWSAGASLTTIRAFSVPLSDTLDALLVFAVFFRL